MTRDQEMQRMYRDGNTLQEIGDIFGVTRARVSQIIGTQGSKAHNGARKKLAREENFRALFDAYVGGKRTREQTVELSGLKWESLRDAWGRLGLELPKKEVKAHGTYYRYSRGCRCDECKVAAREYRANLNLTRPIPRRVHGTYNGYVNYQCRCKRCRAAGARRNKEQRIARRRRKEIAE